MSEIVIAMAIFTISSRDLVQHGHDGGMYVLMLIFWSSLHLTQQGKWVSVHPLHIHNSHTARGGHYCSRSLG